VRHILRLRAILFVTAIFRIVVATWRIFVKDRRDNRTSILCKPE